MPRVGFPRSPQDTRKTQDTPIPAVLGKTLTDYWKIGKFPQDSGNCPSRPLHDFGNEMVWCGVGRKKLDREKLFRSFLLKAEFNLPTAKVLIESLKTNTSWRLLCGWEYSTGIPSEATFFRAFAEFGKAELPGAVHEEIVVENCHDELICHASKDSTAIEAGEKPCRRKSEPAK